MPATGDRATGKPVPRTQAQRRAASERRLLDVTAELIARHGTSSVGFGEIAKAAGCSHGLPSYLFGTKTGLLHALVKDFADRFHREVLEPATRDATGMAALLTVTRVFIESLEQPWPATRAMYVLLGEALGSRSELQTALADYHADLRRTIEGWISEGIAQGDIRRDVHPRAQATLLLGTVRGVGYQVIVDPLAHDVRRLAAELLDAVKRTLAADPGAW